MTIAFPGSPSNGQVYTPGGGAPSYIYNSSIGAWQVYGPALFASLYTNISVASAPTSIGALWWNTTDGRLYIYVNAWVDVANETMPRATVTALGGVRGGNAVISIDSTGTVSNSWVPPDIGRNKLHNSLFNIAQRGTGPFTTAVYGLDRWLMSLSLDTVSVSQVALTDADRAAIGDEEAQFCLQNTFTGNAGSTAWHYISQRIENIRRLGGKTITASFWAKSSSGNPKVGLNVTQIYGTGGSPSTNAWCFATGTAVTLSTTWTRYSATFNLPSQSGTTLGSNNDHCMALGLFCSSGSTVNPLTGNIGVQSGTIKFWGVQLEVGGVMTPLEKPDPRQDLANCMRFFQYHTHFLISNYNTTGGNAYEDFTLPVTMRATPANPAGIAYDTVTYANASGLVTNAITASHIRFGHVITATGIGFCDANLGLSADL